MNQARIGLENMAWTAIGLLRPEQEHSVWSRAVRWECRAARTKFISTRSAQSWSLFLAMAVHHCLQVFKYAPRIASLTKQSPPAPATWPEPLLIHLATMVFTFEAERLAWSGCGAAWARFGKELNLGTSRQGLFSPE